MSIGGGPRYRADGRTPGQLRAVSMTLDVQKWAAASCLIRMGDTHVLCAATVEDRIPPFLRGKGTGWVTSEYSMLPASTSERTQRESVKGRPGGRTHEIQRLIGRALRGVIDKIAEEAVELLGADDEGARREEFGDLLFVVVNLGRKLGVDPEAALRSASRKFAARFASVERMAESDGLELRALGLDELDELWQRAKADERASEARAVRTAGQQERVTR